MLALVTLMLDWAKTFLLRHPGALCTGMPNSLRKQLVRRKRAKGHKHGASVLAQEVIGAATEAVTRSEAKCAIFTTPQWGAENGSACRMCRDDLFRHETSESDITAWHDSLAQMSQRDISLLPRCHRVTRLFGRQVRSATEKSGVRPSISRGTPAKHTLTLNKQYVPFWAYRYQPPPPREWCDTAWCTTDGSLSAGSACTRFCWMRCLLPLLLAMAVQWNETGINKIVPDVTEAT
jgi:hypothetical protein